MRPLNTFISSSISNKGGICSGGGGAVFLRERNETFVDNCKERDRDKVTDSDTSKDGDGDVVIVSSKVIGCDQGFFLPEDSTQEGCIN